MELAPSTKIARAKRRELAKMTPALRAVAHQLDRSEHLVAKGTLRIAYRDGQLLQSVREKSAKYGYNAIDLLAKYRRVSVATFYLNIRMVELWTFEEIEEMCNRYTNTGKQITKSHLFVLCEVEKSKRRDELLDEWFSSDMSVRELRALVRREKREEKKKKGVGRKPARPVSVPAGVHQMVKETASFKRFLQTTVFELLHKIENSPPTEFTEELMDQLREAQTALRQLNRDFTEMENRIDRLAEKNPQLAQEIAKLKIA